jgi:hypothetical protein
VWGELIVLAAAMALQPLPVLASAVLLSVDDGLRKASAFFAGELVVLVAIGVATIALHVGTSARSAGTAAAAVELAVGAALAGGGAWLARSGGADAPAPSWLARLDRMEPWPAFLLGAFLPTYVIAIAAGAAIVGAHPGVGEAVAGLLLFLVVGTSTVSTPILLARFAPERSAPARAALRDWLGRNWRRVAIALLLGVGAFLVAKGVRDLT